MNIHPLFVHFPIALLAMYSVLEVVAYFSATLRRQAWVAPVKSFLLFGGVLTAFAASSTGEVAEDLIRHVSPRAYIIETHSFFAGAATAAYCVLAAAYLVRIFETKGWGDRIVGTNSFLIKIWNFKKYVWHFVSDTWLLPFFALLGLVLLTFAGSLGAAIVYGPDIDPIVSLIYHLFWVQ
ncbi:MAG: DUF2231 domain-containing protein [Minisyncoccia bacterium]